MPFIVRAGYYPLDLTVQEIATAAAKIVSFTETLGTMGVEAEPAEASDHGLFYEAKVNDAAMVEIATALFAAGVEFSASSQTITSADPLGLTLKALFAADGGDLDLLATEAELAASRAYWENFAATDPDDLLEAAEEAAIKRARTERLQLRIAEDFGDHLILGWIDMFSLEIIHDDGSETNGPSTSWSPVIPAEFRPAVPLVSLSVTSRFLVSLVMNTELPVGGDEAEARRHITELATRQLDLRLVQDNFLFDEIRIVEAPGD
jgi:hypothetical protein